MLKKIKSITADEGVFREFSWGTDCPDFAKCNVIYGLNGSGKTVFSQCLSVNSEAGEAKINNLSLNIKNEFTREENDRAEKVKIFNKKYIKENFFVDDSKKIKKIILGKPDIKKTQYLDATTTKIQELKRERESIKNKLSEIASLIKNRVSIVGFTITILNPRLKQFSSLDEKIVSNDVMSELWQDYQRTATLEKQDINFMATLPVEKIEELVSKNLFRVEIIERLAENSAIAQWVQNGITLNEDKSFCQFCEKSFDNGLIEKLKNHFNKEVEALQSNLFDRIKEISKMEQNIDSEKTKMDDFPEIWKDDIENARQLFTEKETVYKYSINEIKKRIDNKKSNPYSSSTINDLIESFQTAENSFNEAINSINIGVIGKFNQKQENINETKEKAKEKIINSMIAQDLKAFYESPSIDGNSVKEKIDKLCNDNFVITNPMDSIDFVIDKEKGERNRLEFEISKIDSFSYEINKGLKYFFGNKNLQIQVIEDGTPGYHVLRSGRKAEAETLSEGERTAITFLYFLHSLESRNDYNENKISVKNIAVIIDDPISSFDIINLHSAFSLMKKKISQSFQFFILTHNMDFLNRVLKWFKGKEKTKEGKENEEKEKVGFFMLEKIWNNENAPHTKIIELPKEIKNHGWIFPYLFQKLSLFQENLMSQSDFLKKQGTLDSVSIPNILRQFLEIYACIWMPHMSELRDALLKIWSAGKEEFINNLLEITNDFSHGNINHQTYLVESILKEKNLLGQMFYEIKKRDNNFLTHLGKDQDITYPSHREENDENKTVKQDNKEKRESEENSTSKEGKNPTIEYEQQRLL